MFIRTGSQLQAIVRARRRSAGLSQEVVAGRAGVSRKWVSEFERGKVSADFALVLRLLQALDLEVHVAPPGGLEPASIGVSTHTVDLDALLPQNADS